MAAKKKIADDRSIKDLTTVQHILLRPGMYLGSVVPTDKDAWILNSDDTISLKKVTYTDALLKIVNEAIDNSFDEYIKTNGEKSTKVSIEITKNTFSIEDNGRGIPVVKNDDGSWQCVNAVCRPMSGSNFTDDNRQSVGANGIGIKGANIFSKKFECVTCDGKGKMKIVCEDNLSTEKHTELTPTAKTGTKITFTPDFKRLGCKEFTPDVTTMIKTRLKFLSWYYPKCAISFNGEKVTTKVKDLVKLFPTPSVVVNNDSVYLCAYASEEPEVLTYVNGMYLPRGGTHVDYIMDRIVESVRDKVGKKFGGIKPSDIKNRLGLVVFFSGFPNCAFDSQTKESLKNLQSDVSTYLAENQVDLEQLTSKIVKEKEMLDNITDLFKAKLELAEAKAVDKANKKTKDVNSEKYFPPAGKTKNKFLMITEGQSAFSGISPILGRQGIGYYMLRGKPMNILDVSPLTKVGSKKKGFMDNLEIKELVNILGLDLKGNTEDMNYDYVVVLSDADADGTAIAALIITMFNKLAPKMLKEGRVCRMDTPLLIGMKGEKVIDYFFNFPKDSDLRKDLKYFYLKGLGSWTKSRLNQVIEKEGGMEKLIKPYEPDETTDEVIRNWFGNDSEPRKDALRGREFHINNA